MSLAFDRSEWFSFDKPSEVPCRHLLATNRCAVHGSLEQRGLPGCAHYDCHGAGQRVTREVFSGLSWRQHPDIARSIFAAFRTLRQVHELLLLLHEAGRLDLPPIHADRRERLLAELEPAAGWTAEALASLDIARHHRDVHAFLRGLRGCVSATRNMRRRLPLTG